MPICIVVAHEAKASNEKTQLKMCLHNFSTVFFKFDVAKATDEIGRKAYEYRGLMPICIVVAHEAKASNEKTQPKMCLHNFSTVFF